MWLLKTYLEAFVFILIQLHSQSQVFYINFNTKQKYVRMLLKIIEMPLK